VREEEEECGCESCLRDWGRRGLGGKVLENLVDVMVVAVLSLIEGGLAMMSRWDVGFAEPR